MHSRHKLSAARFSTTAKIWLSIAIFIVGFIASTALVQVQGWDRETALQLTVGGLYPAAQRTQDAETAFQSSVQAYGDAVVMQETSGLDRADEFGKAAVNDLRQVVEMPLLKPARHRESERLLRRLERFLDTAREVYGLGAHQATALNGQPALELQRLGRETIDLKLALADLRENTSSDLKVQLQSVERQSQTQRQVALLVFLVTVVIASLMVDFTIRRGVMAPLLRINAQLAEERTRAEAASKSKSEFLANVSHELRTPMNGILGMTQMALETDLGLEQREYLSVAQACAASLLDLLNDILDFSKMEAGKLELDESDFDVRDVASDALRVVCSRAFAKGLVLAYAVDDHVLQTQHGDSGRLRQILVNLIGNAVKFTEAGEVVVRVGVERLTADGGQVLRFSVQDTGIGIPPEKQGIIFEAFSQADGSTTRKFGGTGLGLSISRRLVNLMSGQIWLESVVGRGTTLYFTAEFGKSAGKVAGTCSDFSGIRVLVVDGHDANRHTLVSCLRRCGAQVSAVEPNAALLLIRESEFELVCCDLEAPGEIERAQIKQICKEARENGWRVVGLSAFGKPAAAAGAPDGLLFKPFKAEDLLAMLERLFGTKEERAQSNSLPSRPIEPLRILVAEDNAVNQKLVFRLLERQGHAVTLAASGRATLDAWIAADQGKSFDLVLMDVQMPEMDGYDTTRAIRQMEGSERRIPIIALTAHAGDNDKSKCLEAGMDGFLTKPFDIKQIYDTLAKFGCPAEVIEKAS